MKYALLALAVLWLLDSPAGAEVRYRLVPIYPSTNSGAWIIQGLDINNRGDVAGNYSAFLPDGVRQRIGAFVYTDKEGTTEPRIPRYENISALGINDRGQLALTVYDCHGNSCYAMAFRFTPGVGFEAIEGFGGPETEALDINSFGETTGRSQVTEGLYRTFPFRYTDGQGITNLGGLFGYGGSGFAINDRGWVAGSSGGHAFLFRDDLGMLDLGPGRGYAINNMGDVAGEAFLPDGSAEAFLYRDNQRHLLGRFFVGDGAGETYALNLNNYRAVVGWSTLFDVVTAFVWNEFEGMRPLNDFVPSPWHIAEARAINDYGQITGQGVMTNNPRVAVTFRLDPIPPRLSISRTSTHTIVSWTPAWPGLVLEASDNIGTSTWQSVPTGGTNTIAIALDGPHRFFRLNLEGARGLCCVPEP